MFFGCSTHTDSPATHIGSATADCAVTAAASFVATIIAIASCSVLNARHHHLNPITCNLHLSKDEYSTCGPQHLNTIRANLSPSIYMLGHLVFGHIQ